MENQYDLVVIGAGPGGYVAAIKAAKLGLKTAVVEERSVGGTCLNRGCIPAKALIHASSSYREMKESESLGIFAKEIGFDYEKIYAYKNDTVNKLVSGVEQLFKSNKIDLFRGRGRLEKDKTLTVHTQEENFSLKAKNIILAAGSKPIRLPIPGFEHPKVLTSDELFELRELPESLAVIGGGVIGVEFASVFAALGTKVTVLEALPNILANMDKDISQNLKMILKKRGVDVHTSVNVLRVEEAGDELSCVYSEKEKEESIKVDYILCSVGRASCTDGLFGEDVSIETEKGKILVNEKFETRMEQVYAIGDVIKGIQLAHLASAQGICVAERIAGNEPSIDLSVVPSCVYTDPEIACVGITEAEAKAKGRDVKVGKFMMSANGKSVISQEERGFVKVVSDAEDGKILGAQMMCARATDMIGEFTTALSNGMSVEQLMKGMRAHPTYNEAIGEALEGVFGESIHSISKK